jgi:hypothetical protein
MKRRVLMLKAILIVCVMVVSSVNPVYPLHPSFSDEELTKEYDLTFKDKKGDIDFYAMRTVYYHGNAIGITQNREEFLCSFKREVLEISEGSLLMKYTWKSFKEGKASGLIEEITEWKIHSFSDGFTYQFDLNGASYYEAVDFEAVPKDLLGWKFAVNIMDAHAQFECLRNESSGNISKIRKIGDRVMVNDAHKSSSVDFPPVITESYFANGDYETVFTGIGVAGGKKCAVLEYINTESKLKSKTQVNPEISIELEGTSNFWGHMYIDLESGKLIQGDLYEYVVISGTSSIPMLNNMRLFERRLVEIQKISKDDFDRR